MQKMILLALLLIVQAYQFAQASPDFSLQETVLETNIVRDREDANLFYIAPLGIELSKLDDGGPNLSLFISRYIGNRVREDSGTFEIRSTFRVRIRILQVGRDKHLAIENRLKQRFGRNVTLKPFSLSSIKANLVFSSLDDAGVTSHTNVEAEQYEEAAQGNTIWSERDLVLSFDTKTAELIEKQLASSSIGLSLAYDIETFGWRESLGEVDLDTTVSGDQSTLGDSAEVAQEIEDAIQSAALSHNVEEQVIVADAFPIIIDPQFVTSRLKRLDLDGSLPASYPSLSVYFFDLKNGLRTDLFRREVQIRAAGVAGNHTSYSAIYQASRANDYAVTVRFPYAVDLRQAYEWRILDILNSGQPVQGEWQAGKQWTGVLNVSGISALEPATQNSTESNF
jgi:hypothetical protein